MRKVKAQDVKVKVKAKSEPVNPLAGTSTKEVFNKAMLEVKALKDRMLASGEDEKIMWRKKYGMDETGHPVKVVVVDEVTGEVIKKKRGRKPKVKTTDPAITKDIGLTAKISKKSTLAFPESKPVKAEKPVKVAKPVKVVKTKTVKGKSVKKKEKPKGRQASAPILLFTEKESTLEAKAKVFDNAMTAIFANKYDTKKLIADGLTLTVTKTLTKPTAKNPNGVLLVQLSTKDKVAKFYEWANKFWMAQLVNYSHYMKPIKK